jgi:hypothetical protein
MYLWLLRHWGWGASHGAISSLPAPVLTWDEQAEDPTPDFDIDFAEGGVVAGNTVYLELYSDSGLTTLVDSQQHTLDAGDITAGTITLAGDPLPDDTYYARSRVNSGTWSNTVTVPIVGGGVSTAGEAIGLLLILTKAA